MRQVLSADADTMATSRCDLPDPLFMNFNALILSECPCKV